MSQDYGSTSPPSSSTTGIPPSPRKSIKEEGHASVSSSITNLANTVIGAGALAFPSAFAAMGLIPGVLTCLMSGSMTMFGLYLLTRCATLVGQKPGDEGRRASFNEVGRLAFGKGVMTRLFDLAIAIKCFGVSVSYLIICKTLLPQVCNAFARLFNHHLVEHSIFLSQDFWLVVAMAVIIPLSFLKTLDALRFTSQIALSTVVYLLAVVIGWYFVKGPSPTRGEVVLGRFKSNTLSTFPVQVFAYTCAQNIFPVYNELKNKTQHRLNKIIIGSLGSATVVYQILGILGYLTFGSKVGSNIIAMYPPSSLFIAGGRLGIVLLVGLSYPLQCLPCRSCVHLLTTGLIKHRPNGPTTVSGQDEEDTSDDEDEHDPLVPKGGVDGGAHGSIAPEMPTTKFVAITTVILLSGFVIALAVDELEVVLGFVGSTGSTILSFILPGFFYFRLFRKEPGATKWLALALGIYGVVVMCFCLTFNIIHTIRHEGPAGH